MKRLIGLCIAVFVAVTGVLPANAASIPVDDPNNLPLQYTPVLISAVSVTSNPAFVELYNQSDRPMNLHGTSVRLGLVLPGTPEIDQPVYYSIPLAKWLLADSYFAIGNAERVSDADTVFTLPVELRSYRLRTVELINSGAVHSISRIDLNSGIKDTWAQRRTGASGLRDDFAKDFLMKTDAVPGLRGRGWYQPPPQPTGLRVSEVYPHASNCAPNDTSILCGDFIELYNPTDSPQETADYRLRSDSGTSLSGNGFSLDGHGSVPAGGYLVIRLRDDGGNMSLTDDGGYIWLEDAEGVERYDTTIVHYPSASSTTRIGWSWALAGNNEWQWTPSPTPGALNSFPAPGQGGAGGEGSSGLSPCPEGKYRSPDTNRCRTMEETINALAACDEGSERNPETNRCRKTASLASTSLTPCEPGQERNPSTNRCRAVAGVADGSMLTPCKEGQERSPETNRCRKSQVASTTAITDPPVKQGLDAIGGVVLGIVGLAAISYGMFEWRTEIAGAFGRLLAALGKK